MRRRVRKESESLTKKEEKNLLERKFYLLFRNGTLAKPAGVVLASLELNLDNEYFVFVNDGEPLPLSG